MAQVPRIVHNSTIECIGPTCRSIKIEQSRYPSLGDLGNQSLQRTRFGVQPDQIAGAQLALEPPRIAWPVRGYALVRSTGDPRWRYDAVQQYPDPQCKPEPHLIR